MRSNGEADTGGAAGGSAVRDDAGRGRRPRLSLAGAYAIVASVVVLDQLTKAWAVQSLADEPVELIGDFLTLTLTRNSGAAFSTFANGGPWLGVIAGVVATVVAVMLPRAKRTSDRLGLALILGGAIGNLTDRVFRADGFLDGAVPDFIDFSFWPTFNVADSAITIGVIVLLVGSLASSAAGSDETGG